MSQADAEEMARRLAREEGIFAGISAAGACWVALQIAGDGRERDHRLRRLRPRRPLSLDRRLPGMSFETKFCANCATALAPIVGRGRRRREDAPALPGLRLDPLEQPDAGARRGDRAGRSRRPGPARAQRRLAGQVLRPDHRLHGSRRDARGRHRARGRAKRPRSTVDVALADRRLRVPAHEPGHHCLPCGGARRDRAVARAGRLPAVRAGRRSSAGRPAPAMRSPTGCARAASSRSGWSCRPASGQPKSTWIEARRWKRKRKSTPAA